MGGIGKRRTNEGTQSANPPSAPASGANSLTLTGAFDIAATSAAEDSSVPQPADNAAILLSAFKASHSGGHGSSHPITVAQMKNMLSVHH